MMNVSAIMNRRYHGHDLPVPHIYIIPQFLWLISLKYWIKKLLETHQKVLVYVPRKSDAQYYADLLKDTYKVQGVSSESLYLNEYTKDFKEGLLDVLITTTILERGITIEDVQVIVLEAGDRIFDERTLIQIAGRVGRKIGYEDGRILLIDNHYSKAMKECIKTIQKLNRMSVRSVYPLYLKHLLFINYLRITVSVPPVYLYLRELILRQTFKVIRYAYYMLTMISSVPCFFVIRDNMIMP